jgi:hypothetical protein
MPELLLDQIAHFFEHYKDLEPGKWVKVNGWEGPEAAKKEIDRRQALQRRERQAGLLSADVAYRRCPVQRHRR